MAKKRLPPQVAKPKRDGLTRSLLKAIDHMQDLAPGSVAEIHDAPATSKGTPWRMAVRFILPRGTTYDDVFIVLRDWRDDKPIRKILENRLSRIQVRYKDKRGRGAEGEYTLAEIGGWEIASSRAAEKVGIRDSKNRESLIARYGGDKKTTSYIESLIVWFSPFNAKELKIARREKDRTKKDKRRRRI